MKINEVKRLLRDSGGFTLFELLIAIGLLTTVLSLVAPSTYKILTIQQSWQDGVETTRQLRHAESVFVRDALNASSSTLSDLAAATETVSFQWKDVNSTTTMATYALVGSTAPKQLTRETLVNGVSLGTIEIARNVVSVGFTRSGKTIHMDLAVKVEDGATTTTSLRTHLRNLP